MNFLAGLFAVLQRNPLESKRETLQQYCILRMITPLDEKKEKKTPKAQHSGLVLWFEHTESAVLGFVVLFVRTF